MVIGLLWAIRLPDVSDNRMPTVFKGTIARITSNDAKIKSFLPHQSIELLNNVSKLVVCILWGKLELEHEPVDLVDADGHGQLLLKGVLQQTLRIQHDT